MVYRQLLVLFMLMVAGFALAKTGALKDSVSGALSSFIAWVTMPAMYISTFMAQGYSAQQMKQVGIIVALSVFYYLLAIGLSFLFVKLTRTPAQSRGVYQFMLIFSNAAYMGFPVLKAVLGDQAVFLGAFFNLPFNILAFSLGIWLLHRGREEKAVSRREIIFNPGTVGVVIGVALYLLSPLVSGTAFYRTVYQGALWEVLDLLGDCTVPLSMFVIGMVLATVSPGAVFKNGRILLMSVVRLLVIPGIMYLCLRPLGLERLTMGIPVLVSGMPCAVFAVILAKEYGGDEKTASVGVFLTTTLSSVTIPLVALLL